MSTKCRECHRELYSRRRKDCGYCGALIPESLRFTPEEIRELDAEIEDLRERFSEFKRAAAEEEAARLAKKEDGTDHLWPFLFHFL